MAFRKYGSIETATTGAIRRFDATVPADHPCVAVEKVDGCNFSIQVTFDPPTVRYARRTGFLRADEALVRAGGDTWQRLMRDMERQFEAATAHVRADHPDARSVVFFGELIGPGVFTRVAYHATDLAWYGFDVLVDEALLPFDEMCRVYDAAGIARSIVIARGTLRELLAVDPNFQSRVAPRDAPNVAEGLVIQPTTPHAAPNGQRCIVKCKSARFTDRQHARVRLPESTDLDAASAEAARLLCEFATPDRVLDTRSKVGVEHPPARLAIDVLQDVIGAAGEEVDLKRFKRRREIVAVVLARIRQLL